jgi:predicted lipid-binding transport protein (Tim44 family)
MVRKLIVVLSLITFLTVAATESFARMGRGSSSGFRSYNSQRYTQPSQNNNQQSYNRSSQPQQAQPGQRPSFFNSGMFKGLVGGMLLGGLFSMFMGHGFQFGSPGLIEILLIGGIIFLLFRRFTKAKQAMNYQYASNTGSVQEIGTYEGAAAGTQSVSVDEQFFRDLAQTTYKTLQGAWSKGDLASVKNLITARMYEYLDKQLQELNSQGLKNIVEIVYIGEVSVVEVEGEGDNRVAVVRIDTLLRDYTLDKNNNIVEGSKDTPSDAREYWAFVGRGLDWKLDDIRQV